MAADSVWSLYSAPASQAAAVMCLRALASHPCSVPLIVDSDGGIDALISLLYHDVLGEWACICLCLNGICYGSTPLFRIFINVHSKHTFGCHKTRTPTDRSPVSLLYHDVLSEWVYILLL